MNNLPTFPPADPGYPLANQAEASGSPRPKFHLQKFLTCLRKFWWVPALTLTLGITIAVVNFFLTPPVFFSTARMWETEKLRLPDGAAFTEDPQNYLGTQSALMRSDRLRQLALKRMHASGTNVISLDEEGNPLPVEIQVIPTPKSSVFAVQASSANPAYTPAYLDALMSEYLEYKKNVRKIVSGGTLASISEQVLRLERDLKADQEALTQFQRTNNLGGLEEEGTIAGGYLAKLKTQLADYELETRLLDATALEHDPSAAGSTNSTVTSTGAGEGQSAYREIELLKLQRANLSENLRPKHPKIVKLNADIERGQRIIDIYRQQNLEQVAKARKALEIRIASVTTSIKEWEGKALAANGRIAAADRLKQNVARDQNLYDRLVAMLQNVDISRNIDQETLAVLEPASPALRSYQDAKSKLTMAIFLGLASGFGILFLIALRDDRFTSYVEVTEKFGDSVMGQVPEVPAIRGGSPLTLLEHNDDRHIYAESFRNLRSGLLYLAVEGDRPKTLLITSAVPNEGKSTIATNLARSLALGGARVILVDADLRKGHLHDLLALRSNPGLAELLRHPGDLEPFIQPSLLPNLHFIARGVVPANPGDLILNSALDDILARLRQQYDYVIMDSSPVFAADDATTLAPRMDGTLFVVRSHFSRARAVREAIDLLTQRQARVLGLILNRADASARGYHYYNYAEYYAPAKVGVS